MTDSLPYSPYLNRPLRTEEEARREIERKEQCQIVELGVIGWHGEIWTPVKIVGETPKRWRIEAITTTRLPKRAGIGRTLQSGEVALVPKSAVRPCPVCSPETREDS